MQGMRDRRQMDGARLGRKPLDGETFLFVFEGGRERERESCGMPVRIRGTGAKDRGAGGFTVCFPPVQSRKEGKGEAGMTIS